MVEIMSCWCLFGALYNLSQQINFILFQFSVCYENHWQTMNRPRLALFDRVAHPETTLNTVTEGGSLLDTQKRNVLVIQYLLITTLLMIPYPNLVVFRGVMTSSLIFAWLGMILLFMVAIAGISIWYVIVINIGAVMVIIGTSAPFQCQDRFSDKGILIIRIWLSTDRPIFIMGISLIIRQHRFVKTAPIVKLVLHTENNAWTNWTEVTTCHYRHRCTVKLLERQTEWT